MPFPDGPPTPDFGQSPERHPGHPVTQSELVAALTKLWDYVLGLTDEVTRMGEMIMSDQDLLNQIGTALDALTAKESADDASLTASVSALAAAITALQNQPAGTPLDFTAVNTSLAALQGAADANTADIASVAALIPAPPAAPPAS